MQQIRTRPRPGSSQKSHPSHHSDATPRRARTERPRRPASGSPPAIRVHRPGSGTRHQTFGHRRTDGGRTRCALSPPRTLPGRLNTIPSQFSTGSTAVLASGTRVRLWSGRRHPAPGVRSAPRTYPSAFPNGGGSACSIHFPCLPRRPRPLRAVPRHALERAAGRSGAGRRFAWRR